MAQLGTPSSPPEPVLEVPPPQEIKILESAEDIQVNFIELTVSSCLEL